MKTKIHLFALFIFFSSLANSQTSYNEVYYNNLQNVFSNLEKERIPTGLLLDAGIEFTTFKKCEGTLPDSSYVASREVLDIYKTLQLSRFSSATTFTNTVEEFISDWKAAPQPISRYNHISLRFSSLLIP